MQPSHASRLKNTVASPAITTGRRFIFTPLCVVRTPTPSFTFTSALLWADIDNNPAGKNATEACRTIRSRSHRKQKSGASSAATVRNPATVTLPGSPSTAISGVAPAPISGVLTPQSPPSTTDSETRPRGSLSPASKSSSPDPLIPSPATDRIRTLHERNPNHE